MKNQVNSLWENKINKKDVILDVGCWDGQRVESLLGKCKPYGLDIDKNKLNLASKKVKKRLFFGDITKKETLKKITKKKFDWIFLGEVLEHIEKDELALKNINFLLKKNGKLVLTTPKSIFLLEFWDPAWIRWKILGGQRHHHYTKKEIIKKLEKNGFVIKEIRLKGDIGWLFSRWINTILKNVLKIKKTYHCKDKNGFFDWEILAIKK